MDKAAIGLSKREMRQSYTVMERAPWDRLIHDTMIPIIQPHAVVGIYASFNGEVDTYGIIETLFWDSSKTIVLPRVEGDTMAFYKITSFADLKKGHFDILEPVGDESFIPDIMILPLSAFNEDCHRIGYGKGYYDRYLENNPCFSVGVAYDFQKTEEVFQESFDIACDLIVSDKEIYYVDEHKAV